MGGCCSSMFFHVDEKGLDDNNFPYFDYEEQPDDEYKQLDTENDQKGDTAVEHIFRKTKTVYGQPPKDLRNDIIDWMEDYNICVKNRPCPYDFPAFEGDRPADYDDRNDAGTLHDSHDSAAKLIVRNDEDEISEPKKKGPQMLVTKCGDGTNIFASIDFTESTKQRKKKNKRASRKTAADDDECSL